MRSVLAAMSGGVDSAAACGFLQEAGWEVSGATLLLRPGAEAEAEDARLAANAMHLPFYALPMQAEFEQNVICPFVASYQAGKTPNPCIFCNETMKFGLLLDWALAHGFEKLATGHYARVEEGADGRFLLKRAADSAKDQTYMLYRLSQHQLRHILFPLGDKTKAQARQMAEKMGLTVAHKHDSQDICFIPDGDYLQYLLSRGITPQKGSFVDANGKVLGEHRGMEAYTIGQRRGISCNLGKRAYVVEKRGTEIVLGDNESLFTDTVEVESLCLIPFDTLTQPLRVEAKVRYSATSAPAWLEPTKRGARLTFDTPQRAVTPGQSAVFYQGELVIGGGYIAASSCP